jgi:hypothetical protein
MFSIGAWRGVSTIDQVDLSMEHSPLARYCLLKDSSMKSISALSSSIFSTTTLLNGLRLLATATILVRLISSLLAIGCIVGTFRISLPE